MNAERVNDRPRAAVKANELSRRQRSRVRSMGSKVGKPANGGSPNQSTMSAATTPMSGPDRDAARMYAVFISYSHADDTESGRQWATWLHHSLETYEVPPDLIGLTNQRGETVPPTLFPVFRDEEELAADASLSTNIRGALERSRTMVVVCSPRAVASRFVDEEIRYFKELGNAGRIFAIITGGEPSSSPEQEALPTSLRFGVPRRDGTIDWGTPAEPIAADVRPQRKAIFGWTSSTEYRKSLHADGVPRRHADSLARDYERQLQLAKLKVIAGVLGVPLGELTRRNEAFTLAKARKRARVLTAWLAAVGVLAIAAGIAGIVAVRNQREAQQQTAVATEQRNEAVRQRDKALREAYVNIVNQAATQVAAGELAAARATLFNAQPAQRNWEWWFLMARCGPATMKLDELASIVPQASGLKASLDSVKSNWEDGPTDMKRLYADPSATANQLIVDYDPYQGRGGTGWRACRVTGDAAILLGNFSTSMYGELPAVLLGRDGFVCWRYGSDDASGRSPAMLATGEQILEAEADYITFLRDRYIVGNLPNDAKKNISNDFPDFDLTTWTDEAADTLLVKENRERGEEFLITQTGPGMGQWRTYSIGLNSGTFAQVASDSAEAPPSGPAAFAAGDFVLDRSVPLPNGKITVERGPNGPLVLSAWGFGNLRLRDGTTGRIIGESIAQTPSDPLDANYGGSAAIVPGTTKVAGWFWWRDKIVPGVVDLAQQRLVTEFDATNIKMDGWATYVYSSTQVSPDGREVAFELQSRNETYFAVWSTASGKVTYGPFGTLAKKENSGAPATMLPRSFAWHPNGDFVAVVQPNGVTELRKTFGSPSFATIKGIEPSSSFRIQPIGKTDRVIIGDTVMDTGRWTAIVKLPANNYISRDGNLAVIEVRPAVVEFVRMGAPKRLREIVLQAQIRAHDAHADGSVRPALMDGNRLRP